MCSAFGRGSGDRLSGCASALRPPSVLICVDGGITTKFASIVPESITDAARVWLGLVLAVAYGLVLSAFGSRILLDRLLDVDLEADEALVFHVSHVVYGLTHGTWIGSRTE